MTPIRCYTLMCMTSSLPSQMKTSRYAPTYHASSGRSLRGLLAVFGLSALSVVSCSVRHSQTTDSHRLDSVSERVEIRQTPVTLPETKATLHLPLSTLLELPEGAGYHARQGKTSLRLTRRGDSLEAVATTDSQTVLPTIEERVSRHATKASSDITTKQETKTGLASLPPWWILLALVIIPLIILWLRRK